MIAESVLLEIKRDVDKANGNRAKVIERWARQVGKSEKTIYRLLKRIENRKRKVRCDLGKINGVTEEELKKVAAIMMESWTEKYREPIMPAWKAIEIAERMGILEPRQLKPWTLNKWFRENNISKRELAEKTPHQKMKSLYPNHMHQYDVSACAQWYLRADGGIGHQRRKMDVYKNKAGKPRQLKRHLLTDHCSGAFFPLYFMTENLRDSLEFLFCAWQGKRAELILATMGEGLKGQKGLKGQEEDMRKRLKRICERYVFHGVPEILYTDNGTVVRSAIGKQVFANLGIEYHAHEKGNPQAKGGVEGMMWIWERNFESELKIMPARSLLELNVRALESALSYQTEHKHSRHGMMRFEAWVRIPRERLRELPEDRKFLRSLAARASEKRQIYYDGSILFGGKKYKVPDQSLWGKECLVGPDIFNTERCGIVVEYEGKKIKLEAMGVDKWGFDKTATVWGEYKTPKETDTEKMTKEVAQDLSEYKLGDININNLPEYENIKGEEINIDGEISRKIYTRISATNEIINRLGYTPLKWQMGIIKNELQTSEITDDVIDKIVDTLQRRDAKFG